MKLKDTIKKAHGLNVFIYEHAVKEDKKEIVVMAMNEHSAQTKAWKKVSELYKSNGTSGSNPKT